MRSRTDYLPVGSLDTLPSARGPSADSAAPRPSILWKALLIRRTEERLLDLFAEGGVVGTVHCCIGQELVGATLGEFLYEGDTVFSNHRCHGHFLGFTGDVVKLFGEVLGRHVGASRGLGGSQHLHHEGFYSGGILGGLLPVTAGSAMSHRLSGTRRIAVAFLGDGTFGEGVLYETLNLAALWRLPLLFVVEDNKVAQSTAGRDTIAGRLDLRAEAFGIPVLAADCWDAGRLDAAAEQAVAAVRSGSGPLVLLIEAYRLAPHSKGDDHRDPAEIASYWSRDLIKGLLDSGDPRVQELDRQARATVDDAVVAARASSVLDVSSVLSRPRMPEVRQLRPVAPDGRRFAGALRECFGRLLAEDARVLILGEDVEDPYGGAFKATAGLSSLHPGRVRNTPISEAAIVGLGAGLALGGQRVLVEIMFGDFITLAMDQLINQVAKLRSVYGAAGEGQLIVRTPMGGHRGYGPTHSQTLDRHLVGVPGLRVVALNSMVDPLTVFRGLLAKDTDPTVVLENKLLYGRRLGGEIPEGFRARRSAGALPVVCVIPETAVPDVTLLGYGGLLDDLVTAADRLFAEHDVVAQVVCPTQIYPFDVHNILPMLDGAEAVVVAEEGQGFAGFGAEVLAQLCEQAPGRFTRVARVHAAPTAIPASPSLEREVLPSVSSVIDAATEVVRAR